EGEDRTAVIDDIDDYDSFEDLRTDWTENFMQEMIYRSAQALSEDSKGILSFGQTEEWFAGLILENIAQKVNSQHSINSPTGRLVCEYENGGEDESQFLFEWKGGPTAINENCQIESVRPPIQDGLFGNGYAAFNDSANPDNGP